jgi:Na+-translocating ferredoxin:NAD+ oxidoreductase RNF subunit RnfB/two-component sensor histidine kinase
MAGIFELKPAMKNTEAESCKRCYACVRVCPSKAIRVKDGKATLDLKRCVQCGDCIRVCPSGQWNYLRDQAFVRGLLNSKKPVAAVLDTAFPAAFPDMDGNTLSAKLRQLGFNRVLDASFGADLVASLHKKSLRQPRTSVLISSWCPACVDFIRKFDPAHLDHLAPFMPPMTAMAYIVRDMYGDDMQIVYISPCIAHKAFAKNDSVLTGVDAVLTFQELDDMLKNLPEQKDSFPESSGFDPPHGKTGVFSALPLGVSKTAGYPCDPLDTIVTDGSGPRRIIRILDSINTGEIDHGFVDLLFCRGCTDGCAMPVKAGSRYKRRNAVLRHAEIMASGLDQNLWKRNMQRFQSLDLQMTVSPLPLKLADPHPDTLGAIWKEMDEYGVHQVLDCHVCGYTTCSEFVTAVAKDLAEIDMCIQYQLRKLHNTIRDLKSSHDRMNNVLKVLHHSEKLANLAQLSSATAYKLNNPLSVVLLYAHLLKEEYKDNPGLQKDLEIIVDQIEKVKAIFITLLNLSSRNKILLESVDIRELIDRTLMLLQPTDSIIVNVVCDAETAVAEIDREQIGYVLTNIVENALEAMSNGGMLSIHATGDSSDMIIRISDNGPGIHKNALKKIWDPFFTTKRVSVGAGLGLAVAREIIRQHQGTLSVVSNDNASRGPTGTTFTITIPRRGTDVMPGGIEP